MDPRAQLIALLAAAWRRDAAEELDRLGVSEARARDLVAGSVPETYVEVEELPDAIILRRTSRQPRRPT